MRTILVGLLVPAVLASLNTSVAETGWISSMTEYLWRNRPLIVFAPHSEHPILASQREALSGYSGELRDRDMVVIEVVSDDVTIDGYAAKNLKAAEMRKRYGLRSSDTVALLVGKDGGVKLRRSHALSVQTLLETIDAMPMRRQEMSDSNRNRN